MRNKFTFRSVNNSVLAAGLFFGFLSAFSIRTSHLLFLRTLVFEQDEKKQKIQVAKNGMFMGQILMLISQYNKPLHIVLTTPRTITALGLFYIFSLIFWNSQGDFFPNQNSRLNLCCIFIHFLLLQQLLNICLVPGSFQYKAWKFLTIARFILKPPDWVETLRVRLMRQMKPTRPPPNEKN